MSVGARIKRLRKSKGWSQSELGKKINLSFSGVSLIEADKNSPSIDVILKLREIFEISADYLLSGKEELTGISSEEKEILIVLRKDKAMTEAVMKVTKIKKKAISYLGGYKAMNAQGLKSP